MVGAPGHSESGAVFVFGTGSRPEASSIIIPFQGNPGDGFGSSLDLLDSMVLIGSPISEIDGVLGGAAFIYRYDAEQGLWIQEDNLEADAPSDLDYFGTSVALSENMAVVGSPGDDQLGSNAGAAFVFTRDVAGWALAAKLVAPEGAEGDRFGEGVAIDGDLILVGGPFGSGDHPRTGIAHLFSVSDGSFEPVGRLDPPSSEADQGFGAGVDLKGGFAFVGAPGPGNLDAPGGTVTIFGIDNASVDPQPIQVLQSGDSVVDEGFGNSLEYEAGFLIVGSQRTVGDHLGPGSAHVFERSGGTWSELSALVGSEASKADGFGGSVSISAEYAAVGAPGDGTSGPNSGSVYFYRGSSAGWR
jgi:hypothetical protein